MCAGIKNGPPLRRFWLLVHGQNGRGCDAASTASLPTRPLNSASCRRIPVGNLQKARSQLVKQRRSYVAQIASGSSNDEQFAEAMAQIVEIQQSDRRRDF
jgi:hypothetical protein